MKNIYLVGPMGVGKTTVGRLLSDMLNFQFYDVDDEIEKQTGASISWIFEKEQEFGFRRREEKMTKELCLKNSIVLATGGGVVLSEENRNILKNSGYVVYLTASIDTLFSRTSKDKSRPLLQEGDLKEKITQIFNARALLYESIADFTVVSCDNPPYSMAKQIFQHISTL